MKEQEVVNRSRIASIVILVAFVLAAAAIPGSITYPNKWLRIILIFVLLLQIGAFVLNRRGHIIQAGILVVFSSEVGIAANIVTQQPISSTTVPLFDVLVQSLAFAVSLLPAYCVFIVAGLNVLFSVSALLLLPHTADFTMLVVPQLPLILIGPLVIQASVAVVTFTWVTLSNRAIFRAYRLIQENKVKQAQLNDENVTRQKLSTTLFLIEAICDGVIMTDQTLFGSLSEKEKTIVHKVLVLYEQAQQKEET